MKSRHLTATAALAILTLFSACKSEKENMTPVIGSIRPTGSVKTSDMPALTKVSFADAMKNALTAVPGNVTLGELEIEDGNLQYSFDIVGPDKSVTEVEIDAGNGKVLATDKE